LAFSVCVQFSWFPCSFPFWPSTTANRRQSNIARFGCLRVLVGSSVPPLRSAMTLVSVNNRETEIKTSNAGLDWLEHVTSHARSLLGRGEHHLPCLGTMITASRPKWSRSRMCSTCVRVRSKAHTPS
jgi:hypothetical protein